MPYIFDENDRAVYVPPGDDKLYDPPEGYTAGPDTREGAASRTGSTTTTTTTTTVTVSDVEAIFAEFDMDPTVHFDGTVEEGRAQRLADAINSGDYSVTELRSTLDAAPDSAPRLSDGTEVQVLDPNRVSTADDPFQWPDYVAPDPTDPYAGAEPIDYTQPWVEETDPIAWAAEVEAFREPEDLVRSMVSWLPGQLADVFVEGYIESGSFEMARERVRQHESYDQYFPGNRRDDGSLRYTEEQYLGIVEGYEDALLGININPDLFSEQFGDLVAGLVSPNEFRGRVDELYARVISSVVPIRDFYAENYGIGMTDSAIIASVINPDIGDAIINERIAISEIGGEARLHEFGINLDLATELYQRGLTRTTAGQVFTEAASDIPILDVLARRHQDPDDDFDLNDFLAASVFGDPEERLRIRRLLAAERSLFSPGARLRREAEGQITGLRQR